MITKAIPDVFGMRAIGAIMGVLSLGWRAGAALGPAAAGFVYDVTGSYAVPFGAAPLVVLVSWGLFALGSSRRVSLAWHRRDGSRRYTACAASASSSSARMVSAVGTPVAGSQPCST